MRPRSGTVLASGIADFCALLAAFTLAYRLHFSDQVAMLSVVHPDQRRYLLAMAVLIPLWLAIFALRGLYNAELCNHGTALFSRVTDATALAALLTLAGGYIAGSVLLSRGWLLIAWLAALVLTLLARTLLQALLRRFRRPWRMLIAGACQTGARALELLSARSDMCVIGFLDDYLALGTTIAANVRVVGHPVDALRISQTEHVDELLVVDGALARESYDRLLRLAYTNPSMPALRLIPSTSGELLVRLLPAHRGALAILLPELGRVTGVRGFAKAVLDKAVAACLLLVISPFWLALWCVAVVRRRALLRGVVMVGEGGRRFRRWSLAGAGQEEDTDGTFRWESVPEQYRWRYIIAKLPRALNVLRGDLSLVGPRPIAERDLALFSEWSGVLLAMKPGLVGPWLLHGQSRLTPEQELQADISYVRDHRFLRDLVILAAATWQVLVLLTRHRDETRRSRPRSLEPDSGALDAADMAAPSSARGNA